MIRKRLAALEAIVEQAVYIGNHRPSYAARFIDAVEATLKELEGMPKLGRAYPTEEPGLAELRLFQVKGFPNHLIFYREVEDGIDFVHLIHGARDLDDALLND